MLVFVIVGGAAGAIALAFVGVAVIGTFGITMVMAQQYLPTKIGMASGLSIGFSIGLGGIAAVFLGAVADSVDLPNSALQSARSRPSSLSVDGAAAARARAGVLEPEIAVP